MSRAYGQSFSHVDPSFEDLVLVVEHRMVESHVGSHGCPRIDFLD